MTVDITVIRSWLGHVSLDTTNHYAQANLETKRKALERVGAPASGSKPPSWKRDASVLTWLDTLWNNVKDAGTNSAPSVDWTALLHIISCSRLLRVVKNDKRAIFTAAGYAEAAAALLHGLQPEAEAVAEADDTMKAAA